MTREEIEALNIPRGETVRVTMDARWEVGVHGQVLLGDERGNQHSTGVEAIHAIERIAPKLSDGWVAKQDSRGVWYATDEASNAYVNEEQETWRVTEEGQWLPMVHKIAQELLELNGWA